MIKTCKQPLIKITFSFILGIALSKLISNSDTSTLNISLTLLACSVIILLFLHRKHSSIRAGFLLFGMMNLGFSFSSYLYKKQNFDLDKITAYQCKITKTKLSKNNQIRCLARIYKIKNETKWITHDQEISLIFPQDSIIQISDLVLIKNKPKRIRNSKNSTFDYQKFMNSRNIFYEHRTNKFKRIGTHSSLISRIKNIRSQLSEILKKQIQIDDGLGILNAMLLGNKNLISEDEKNVYRKTGAMHVLAVSGLHVGIISQLLILIFGFLERRRKVLFLILCLSFLWLYACITGLSPSIIRASIMFSMLLIARIFQFQHQNLNIIFASALLILLFDPNQLFGLSFQFSYIAVLGIVLSYPIVHKQIHELPIISKHIVQITSVSLAAQLALSPLLLYYFHEIPSYGLLSNLFVVYFATLSLILGILILTTFPLALSISDFFSSIYSFLYQANSMALDFVNQLPYTSIKIDSLSFTNFIGITAIFFSVILFLNEKKFKWLASFMVCLNLLLFTSLYQKIEHRLSKQNKTIISTKTPK